MGAKPSKQSPDVGTQTNRLDRSDILNTERPKQKILQKNKEGSRNHQENLKRNSRKLIDFSSIGSKFNHSKTREIFHKITKHQQKAEVPSPKIKKVYPLSKESTPQSLRCRRMSVSILKDYREDTNRSKMYSFTDLSTRVNNEEKQGLILDDCKSDLLPKLQNFASSAIFDKILNETPLDSEVKIADPDLTTLKPSYSEFKYSTNSAPSFELSNFASYPQAVSFPPEQPMDYSEAQPKDQFRFLEQVPTVQYSQLQNSQIENSQLLYPVVENSQIETSHIQNQQLFNSTVQNSDYRDFQLNSSQLENSQFQPPNLYTELSHIPTYLIEAFRPETPSSVPFNLFSFNKTGSEIASQGPMRYWPDSSATTVSASLQVPRITDDLAVDLTPSSRKRLQIFDPKSPSIKEEEPGLRLNIIPMSKTDIEEESKYVINIPKKHLLSFDGEMSLPKLVHKTSLGVD